MSNLVYPNQIFGIQPQIVKAPKFATIVQKAPGGAETRIAQMQNPLWQFQLGYEVLFNTLFGSGTQFGSPPYSVTELQELLGFFLARQGQFDDFLFDDPEDDTVTNQALQLILQAGTPPLWYSPIQRNMGAQFLEDVTDLNPINGSGLVVKVNGFTSSASTDFSFLGPGLALTGSSFLGMYLEWKPWQASFGYTLGTLFIDPAGHLQRVTAASGASGATEPTFNDSGSTTTDGAITWQDEGVAAVIASFQFYFRLRFAEDTTDFERFLAGLYTVGGAEAKNGKGYVKMVTSRPVTS